MAALGDRGVGPEALDLMVGLVEKPLLRAVLRETGGNQVRAAQTLGINRTTLRKKLIEHGSTPAASRADRGPSEGTAHARFTSAA